MSRSFSDGSRRSSSRIQARKRKNEEIDQGRSVKKFDNGSQKAGEMVFRCLEQMREMTERMEVLSREVAQLGRRVESIESKVGQMYPWFLAQNEQATPVLTPPFSEEMEEDQDPLNELFKGLLYQKRECGLLSGDHEFEKKLTNEWIRVNRQAQEQKANENFTKELERLCKESFPPMDSDTQEVYDTLKSPLHLNQDAFTQFSIDINFRGSQKTADVFAVLDGHGPPKEIGFASLFCRDNFKTAMEKCMTVLNTEGRDYTIANALKISFVLMDSMFKDYMEQNYPRKKMPGTTACLAMIVEGTLYVANCGDSRAILNTGNPDKTFQLSYDFKASDEYAQKTTTKRKGEIKFSSRALRVNGSLAITRAIGDEFLRKEGDKPISSRPKIVKVELNKMVEKPDQAFIALGSDGLFDVASSDQAGKGTCQLLMEGKTPREAARLLIHAARNAGSNDDITLGVIPLKKYLSFA